MGNAMLTSRVNDVLDLVHSASNYKLFYANRYTNQVISFGFTADFMIFDAHVTDDKENLLGTIQNAFVTIPNDTSKDVEFSVYMFGAYETNSQRDIGPIPLSITCTKNSADFTQPSTVKRYFNIFGIVVQI